MYNASPLDATLAPLPAPMLLTGERGYFSEAPTATEAPELIVAPAVTYTQLRACSGLVRRMYARRGYRLAANPLQPADPSHVTIGAWLHGQLVATATASRDSAAGLLADGLYRDEVAKLRGHSRIVCEVTRLAVDAECYEPEVLGSLFLAIYQYVRAVFGGTELVIEVNPRHAGYYRRTMGFHQIGELRSCPRVEAPAVLLHRSLGNIHY
ncbi:hypothetical protein LZ012_10260 [Dechloromonas sp. XY25]|uniref:N-acyl amino acid synthase FeeM catalytic core domain-containing protein n=1 Tax=Dechloromonas hankyongensis TaxID=2908002 RepID=A0ABS9K2G9_9RHOO|nr:hypothetical protein [Dechloromonas hankyongensis]MCG2577377.1 hypothetical protein [Dechloromonas hankyongensis]